MTSIYLHVRELYRRQRHLRRAPLQPITRRARNSALRIWDDADPDGGSHQINVSQQAKFYANYSNATSKAPIVGANCTVQFPDQTATMTYNATSRFYEYNRTFTSPGLTPYNISCNATLYQRLNLTDSIMISKPRDPQCDAHQSDYCA